MNLVNKLRYISRLVLLLPIALLSVSVYKLALQPAIRQFYEPVPDLPKAYMLVVLAALIHALLLGSLLLKAYAHALKPASMLIGLTMLLYALQMTWFSPLAQGLFWAIVWATGMLVWLAGLWVLQRLVSNGIEEMAKDGACLATSSAYTGKDQHKASI